MRWLKSRYHRTFETSAVLAPPLLLEIFYFDHPFNHQGFAKG